MDASTNTPRTKLEPIAFQFCKIATFCVIFQRFALPAAALFAATLYFVAYAKGERETRCWLRHYLLIGFIWTGAFLGWVYLNYFRS